MVKVNDRILLYSIPVLDNVFRIQTLDDNSAVEIRLEEVEYLIDGLNKIKMEMEAGIE